MRDNKIRRINFFGGACCGKSTTAASVFAELKKNGKSAELVDEYIKFWTYIPRIPKGYDSLYVMAKQIHKEDTILRSGTDFIVSDSPIMLQYFYAVHHKSPSNNAMLEIANDFERCYPSFNIVLERNDEDYDEHGRYETLEQAKAIDEELVGILDANGVCYHTFNCRDNDGIISCIKTMIEEDANWVRLCKKNAGIS